MEIVENSIIGLKRTNESILEIIEDIIDSANEFILIGAYNFNLPDSTIDKIIKSKCLKIIIMTYIENNINSGQKIYKIFEYV